MLDPLTSDSLRILIVDDNVDLTTSLHWLLACEGYEVSEANSATACLALIETKPFDLIFIDLAMPSMNGIDLGRQLKKHPACAGTRLIAYTGRSDAIAKGQAIAAGFDAYVVKTIDWASLLDLMKSLDHRIAPAA